MAPETTQGDNAAARRVEDSYKVASHRVEVLTNMEFDTGDEGRGARGVADVAQHVAALRDR